MNQEPKHRADAEHEQPKDADPYLTRMVDLAADQPTADRLRNLYQRHGTAFALYLTLGGVDQNVESVAAEFANAYVGHYPDQEAVVQDTIESFDWGVELQRRLADADPLFREMVKLDHQAVWEFASEYYEIVDHPSGLYLYELGP